ncbi:MAG: FAD-dependent oxidoreductase [Bacteroidetes bacterium]|jgi:predicted NAD/FAD-dependent oxidoreductase|nr:FAD-dependent oxidoreductase [Bacteroidota bacterium]
MATPQIGIIGAGIAGCAAAFALRDTAARVTLIDKARGVSGRATTRRRDKIRYDHGANFFKLKKERHRTLVHDLLPSEGLVRVQRPLCTFTAAGECTPIPETEENQAWTYRGGIHTLGKHLATASGATVHLRTRIAKIHQAEGAWAVEATDGRSFGPFDQLLLTPPAPQTADLLAGSDLPPALAGPLIEALRASSYESLHTLILGYHERWARTHPFYGFANADGAYPIGWLSFEEDKPGHVPADQRVLICQMQAGWSEERFDMPPEELAPVAATHAADLLKAPAAAHPDWVDHQRWRYAQPTAAAATDVLSQAAPQGLFFAGDFMVGQARVPHALQSGLDVAAAMVQHGALVDQP